MHERSWPKLASTDRPTEVTISVTSAERYRLSTNYTQTTETQEHMSTKTTDGSTIDWHDDPRARLEPTSIADFGSVKAYVVTCRQEWLSVLRAARRELQDHLVEHGWSIASGAERAGALRDEYPLTNCQIVVQGRLKTPDRIVEKMSRFNEALTTMLDLWGFRIIVSDEGCIDRCVRHVEALWARPTSDELLLRHGTLAFPPKRDYRQQDHAGLSAATSDRYDEAVHMNRRRSSGICEIQVMTHGLFSRAFVCVGADEAHRSFAHRRHRLVHGGSR